MGIVSRKIYKSAGGRAYAITLPREWVEALGTDEVVLMCDKNYIVIIAKGKANEVIEAAARRLIAKEVTK